MPLVNTTGLVHFSLPANNVDESLRFYTEILGMKFRGNVGGGKCVTVGDVNIILAPRPTPRPVEEIDQLNTPFCHYAFYVSSADFDRAYDGLVESGVRVDGEPEYRRNGTFNGRSLYFWDPTGNRLELNDPNPPSWPEGV